MGSRLRTAARDALATWGALSLIGLIAAAGFLAYSFYFPGTPLDDRASKDDVRFVLNRPGLGDERIESVVRSHESVVHVNGDHFVAYAIRVTSLSESELSAEKDGCARIAPTRS